MEDISEDPEANKLLFDTADTHAKVLTGIYTSMLHFNRKSLKEAISSLNEVINTFSFKDYFHESINVKLTLAYFYLIAEDYDMVENTLKGITRKIKSREIGKIRLCNEPYKSV